ncbi:MAG TPA: hypothetical protein VKV17_20785 [Bryobacteraceae bacterium]|nr:hypothetical protein [Bryobacteraceae bacterium]
MDLAHVHVLLNHFPVIGTIIAFGLLVLGILGRSGDVRRASLAVFLGLALVTLAVYVSGNGAAENLCKAPATSDEPCQDAAVSRALIDAHESAALLAFAAMELTGAFAWLGLWRFRRMGSAGRWNLATVFALAAVTIVLMARAANLGGDIRHPEIRGATLSMPPHSAGASLPFARAVGATVTGATWIWPTCETLHFIGLSLLFGITAMVDLRVLGWMKPVSFQALHRLLPWGVLGFGVNLASGMLFFVADPDQYTHSAVFQWKIALVLLAGLNLLYFTLFDAPWSIEAGDDAPPLAKFAAASALVLVVGVMFCGRMLPFLGDSF